MLIIFDVDGTLIGGEEYDWRAFNKAFTEITGRKFSVGFWKELDDVTASAIVHEGLSDLPVEQRSKMETEVKVRCLEFLQAERTRCPEAFLSTRETKDLLEYLLEHDEFDIAIATGDWYETIQYKMDAAGIELARFVHATSSDAQARAEIITLAAERSSRSLSEAVYVGDGSWDLRACRKLGIPFIGTGNRIDELKKAGAQWTIETLETAALLDVLSQISEPK